MQRALVVFLAIVGCGPGRAPEAVAPIGEAVPLPVDPPPPLPDPPAPPLVATTPIARADVEADVAVLRDAYEALHPGLDRYTTREERDAMYAQIVTDAGERPTVASVYLALVKFTAGLRCGHTYVNPHNQSEPVQAALFAEPRLPFLFRWIDGDLVVTKALSADAPPVGTVITSIDGQPAPAILATLVRHARADGGNDAKRVAQLGLIGERFEAFDVLYPWVFPRAAGPYVLGVRNADWSAGEMKVAPITAAERDLAVGVAAEPAADAPAWQLEMLDPTTGYLRMPTWALYDRTWDWQAAIDRDVLALVQGKAKRLIVDLRGNEGGLDVGNRLVQHLIGKRLAVKAPARRTRYRTVPDALRPNLKTWDPSFFDWGEEAKPRTDGFFDLGTSADEALAPIAPRFRGKVIVLIDAVNSSATFQFAQLVQRHRLATLVGEPTGGNQRGINGGAFFFLRLPATGLEVDLPLIGRFPDGKLPDAGIEPDVGVPTTAADLARGHDAVLERARTLR